MAGHFRFLEGKWAFLQSQNPPRTLPMKSPKAATKTCVALLAAALFSSNLQGADLEDVYQQYLQGNYIQAQKDLNIILGQEPDGDQLLEMKRKLGARALLELSQNSFLRDQMKVFNAVTWQKERGQFKSPRRIKFFIDNFMEDDSTRHKSMPNILAAGCYAIPHIIDYLKVDNEDIETRTLAYQLVLNMGSEAIPALTACTFSNDPILQVNAVRLLSKTLSARAIPYLLRLKETSDVKIVLEEVEVALASLGAPEGLSSTRSYIDEANRYLAELSGVQQEAIEADSLLWTWDEQNKNLVADNPLSLDFEYQPQYPLSLWGLFKAELMHREFSGLAAVDPTEVSAAQASALCTWAAQEHRVQELLKNPEISGVTDITEQLNTFLQARSQKLTVAHWVGTDVLLQAVDMAQNSFPAHVTARILRMIAGYQPKDVSQQMVTSFVTGEQKSPLLAGLHHPEELIRYWSAITIARCDKMLQGPHAPLVIDLLQQSIDEVGMPSALLVSQQKPDAEEIQMKLQNMGYMVQWVHNDAAAVAGLRSYPSKDLLIIDPDFGYENDGLGLINQVRQDPKGKALPIVILSNEERSGDHVITYQEQAQQMIFGSDSIETLKNKFSELKMADKHVTGPDLAAQVSRESLNALALLNADILSQYPGLVSHLIQVADANYQPEGSQIMAIRSLRKMGPLAAQSIPNLLKKLSENKPVHYQIVVLHALLNISQSDETVREKLYGIITDPNSPQEFKQMAASYLSGEGQNLSTEERAQFQKTFFSRAFLGQSGS